MNVVFAFQRACLTVSVLPGRPQGEVKAVGLKDQQVLGVWGYCQLFQHSIETLRSELQEKGDGAELVWDKVSSWYPPACRAGRINQILF